MPLTKQDLNAISSLIEEKLESKLEEKLESKLEEKLESKLNEKLKPIQKDINRLKKGQKQIRQDINMVIGVFDRDIIYSKKRLDRVENHLNLPPLPKTA